MTNIHPIDATITTIKEVGESVAEVPGFVPRFKGKGMVEVDEMKFVKLYYNQLGYDEIAKLMGVSRERVGTIVRRADQIGFFKMRRRPRACRKPKGLLARLRAWFRRKR